MKTLKTHQDNTAIKVILFLMMSIFSQFSYAEKPTEVFIGLRIDQIPEINQKQENFKVVATLKMNWIEPRLAFSKSSNGSDDQIYTIATFLKLLESKHIQWPSISYSNLQGKISFETQIVKLSHDGTVNFMERFTATFQAPDFNFRRFPLDHQYFFINIDSHFSESKITFKELPGFSGMGSKLGEEEWIIMNVLTKISNQTESAFEQGARFSLQFEGERHLNYYVIRILIPVLLIIIVSWFTFFLRDYTKRIDLAGANLLLFIAFNFTISNDMPRLGYITLIDTFLVGSFIITSMVVLVNVMLRRLENGGRKKLAEKMDFYAITGYPLAYFIGSIVLSILFL